MIVLALIVVLLVLGFALRAKATPAPILEKIVVKRGLTNHARKARCLPPLIRVYVPAFRVPVVNRPSNLVKETNRRQNARAKDSRCAPTTWRGAVAWAQRPFPGTSAWLYSCSASEGGHTEFIMNNQGSGAGGWMQFMSGTFYSNVDAAFASSKRQGHAVPSSARSWYHPLGQAVTAAWMYLGGQRGQWAGAGC